MAMVAAVVLPLSGAGAQTGYPPGPCTVLVSSSAFGSATIGSTITLTLTPTCVWTTNSAVAVSVNGQSVGTKTASANGTVTVTITVLSATSLSVDDPVIVPTVCGTNTVVGRGTSTVASGNVVTHTATFTVVCPAVPATPTATTRFALTGANMSRWIAIALVMVIGGALFMVAGRRRKQPPVSV